MAERIPQSVSKLVIFRAFLSSDGKTPATGKTIAITISKNGAAFGNPNAGALNATEISSGFYKFTLDTTDSGTLGPVAWRGAEGTIGDAGDVFTVADPHNAGFDALPSAAANASGGVHTNGVGSGQFSVDGSGNADANVINWKGATAPAMTGDAFARLGAPAGASTAADIAAIKSDTGTILTDVNTGAGAIYTRLGAPANGSIAADIAQIEAQAVTLVARNNPLTAAATASALWQDAAAGDFIVANSIGKALYNAFGANTSVFTIAALANAPAGGGGGGGDPWAIVFGAYASNTFGGAFQTFIAAAHTVTFLTPYDPTTGILTLVRGADYKATENRALEFYNQAGSWPTLNGTITFLLYRAGRATVSVAGSIISASGPTQQVQIELTNANLNIPASAIASPYFFEVIATQSNGHIVPLVGPGLCVVQQNAAP
jgi:hypothetical protein